MKVKLLLLLPVMLLLAALRGLGQDVDDIKPSAKDIIPFGKKLPPPDLTRSPGKSVSQMTSAGANNDLAPRLQKPDIKAMKKTSVLTGSK